MQTVKQSFLSKEFYRKTILSDLEICVCVDEKPNCTEKAVARVHKGKETQDFHDHLYLHNIGFRHT